MGWRTQQHKNNGGSGIKVGCWNKGGANQPLHEKSNEIEELIKENNFTVFGVVEANFFAVNQVEDIEISGYNVVWDKGRENSMRKNARTVLFIRQDIGYKIRNDLMDESTPEIWIELGKNSQKKIWMCLFYREFSEWG